MDDIIITGNNCKLIHSLISQMNSMFSLKDIGELDYFLGIEVQRQQDGSLILTQSKYIHDLLTKTNMDESNPISSPMVRGCKLTKFGSKDFSDPTQFLLVPCSMLPSLDHRLAFLSKKFVSLWLSPLTNNGWL